MNQHIGQNNIQPQKPAVNMELAVEKSTTEDSAFGEWDIRREPNMRNNIDEGEFVSVEKKEFETFSRDSSNDDETLNTPPFFRRKR